MVIHQAFNTLLLQLYDIYDDREAATIADMVMEHVTGLKRIDRSVHRDLSLTEKQQMALDAATILLMQHMPVQYVLQKAWFAGMEFYVNKHVLIPRPETEELVDWILKDNTTKKNIGLRILDIGTGSGCIPISIKKKLPNAEVHAADISQNALDVAKQNADALNAKIHFHLTNILNKKQRERLSVFDIIISNPPYIAEKEKEHMHNNVLLHEPHLALFVADNDPLIFYTNIADFAKKHLAKNGVLYFEINESYGNAIQNMLQQKGFTNVVVKKDMQQKDRMVKAEL